MNGVAEAWTVLDLALHLPPRIDYATRLLLSWTSAALLAFFLATGTRLRRHEAIGIALMSVPLWLTVWHFYNSFQVLADPTSTLRPYTRPELSALYYRSFLTDLGYLGTGFLLYASGGSQRGLFALTPRTLAARLAATGFPMGARSEVRSAAFGWAVFPLLLAGTVAVSLAASGVEVLQRGDESRVWEQMTVYHAFLISLAAGFGEELVYRGFLLVVLVQVLRRVVPASEGPGRAREGAVWATAIAVQALVFGFAHAGYGTLIHVILPTLFGLVAGIAAWRYGIWSAIVLHVLVDVYIFGAEAGHAGLLWLLGLLLVANVIFAAALAAYAVANMWQRRQAQA